MKAELNVSATLVAIMVCMTFIVGCSRPPAEEAVATVIESSRTAAEAGNVGDLMSHLADDFGTVDGAMDRSEFRRFVLAHSRINRNVGVTITGLDIRVDGERATAEFRTLITGGNGRFIPERGRLFDVKAGLRDDGDEWQVINADWTPVFGG